MILFCDTSALLKLYITEAGSSELKLLIQEAEAVAVCPCVGRGFCSVIEASARSARIYVYD
jgi:predicted nucleic acid-binding protein